MAAIKLFGTTIAVDCSAAQPTTAATVTTTTTTTTTTMSTSTSSSSSSSSSSSNQGAAGGEPAKKPDKIIPCPRCKSMDTKFCYFNNYNVNQPRHFCKGCHRYWTAGGALRNVPVGAGRRKTKPPTPTPHQPCRPDDLGYGAVDDDANDHEEEGEWRAAVEQGSLGQQQQQLDRIKRRRTSDIHSKQDQCY